MDIEIYEELVSSLAEDYSLEELANSAFMEKELAYMLGSTPQQAAILAIGAYEIKLLRANLVPNWKPLCVIN